LEWVYVGDEGGTDPKAKALGKGGAPSSMGRGKWGRGGVIDDVWEMWRANKIDETLSGLLLDKIAGQGKATLDMETGEHKAGIAKGGPRVFDGGDTGKAKGGYTPLLKRERQDPVEVVNKRYRVRRGVDASQLETKEEDADE
jgi:tRNA pseudouridine38/39 synthase